MSGGSAGEPHDGGFALQALVKWVSLDFQGRADRYDAATVQLAEWVKAGKLRYREDILDGIEACPDAVAGLYRGENLGKRLIRL